MIVAACNMAKNIQKLLDSKGVSTWLCSAWEADEAKSRLNGTDLIISVGGDGTILRAAQIIVPGIVPVTGVNLGRLGFMTELDANEAMDRLADLLAGEGWIDERAMLEAELFMNDKGRDGTRLFYALNDVVVARGAAARIISIDASINGEPLTTYKADGVIVATATGSTGYSLAAGGPILPPQARECVLLPILPHLSLAYPLVLSSGAVVELKIGTTHEATLSIDGHINLPIPDGAVVNIKRGSSTVKFLRIHPENSFYSSLEQRLKGKRLVEHGRKS